MPETALLHFEAELDAYLKTYPVPKLQIGAGHHLLEGWFNTDINLVVPGVLWLDTSQPFPIADHSFAYVMSEHHIEHIAYQQGVNMLQESFRVLKPGGKIRISTPDLGGYIKIYTTKVKTPQQQEYINLIREHFMPWAEQDDSGIFVLNNAFRNWEHQFLFDEALLNQVLNQVGFVNVVRKGPWESDDEHLRQIENRGDNAINNFETVTLEAQKPL